MLSKYVPSGRCSPLIIPVTLALIVAAVGAGIAYQWALDHFTTRRIPFLLVAGMAFACGAGGWSAAALGRSRSPLVGLGAGLLIGLAALASSHAVKYRHAVARGAPAPILANFEWRAAQGIGGRPATATRQARPSKYTGGRAKAAWWVEAALLGLAGVVGGVVGSCRPFCEHCRRYAGSEHWTLSEPRPPDKTVEAIKKAGSVGELYRQVWDGSGAKESSIVYAVRVCPGCAGVPTLTVTHTRKGGGNWWLGWLIGWVAWLWSSDSTSELHAGILLNEEDLDAFTEWAAARPGFEASALEGFDESDAEAAL